MKRETLTMLKNWDRDHPLPEHIALAREKNRLRRADYASDEWYIGADGNEYRRPTKDQINAKRREYYYNNQERITEQQRERNYPNTKLAQYHDMLLALDIEREKRAK